MTPAVDVYETVLPPQPEGEVLRYGIELTMADGERLLFPDNAADPQYEAFLGVVTPIYCTDFEADPMEDGWTSELIEDNGRRPRNEWEWGARNNERGSGDPDTAFSGDNAVGNDLGLEGHGTYGRSKIEELVSPAIVVGDHQKIRLQYRDG